MDQITAQRRFTAIFFTAFPRLGNDQAEKRMTADEEMRVLMLMQAIRRNETLWRWLYDEEKGNFSERHMLQLLGWLYDKAEIRDYKSKKLMAISLKASGYISSQLETIKFLLSFDLPIAYLHILEKLGASVKPCVSDIR